MKTKTLLALLCVAVLLSGCAATPHIIGYGIVKNPLPSAKLGKIFILPLNDERPQQEHEGVKGELLTFSSRDAHFSQKVSQAIEEILIAELENSGFSIIKEQASSDYVIWGSVKHFQAIMAPAKITFLPYLGSVSTLWAKDEFTIALSIYIKMVERGNNILIDQTFDVSQDSKLPTGLLSLARYSRGFNYKVKLLDEALKDVMQQICDQVKTKVKSRL